MNIKNTKKICLIAIIIILFLSIAIGATYLVKSFEKESFYNTLNSSRQENYDKMKIEYVEIKDRKTGTAPFNTEATTSNEDGIDVSETDNYVRTSDYISYNIEVGIAPNTNIDGVTDSSIFYGGVIKVKAKLPNQGDLTLMTWGADAWMQNVTYNEDKTEIYAEYHISSDVSISNFVQNLTFKIKVNGYKKEITSEMLPEFEVWMEGNQPDDSSSTITSIVKKETNEIIISGKYSLNAILEPGDINFNATKNGVSGNYYDYTITIGLYQPYSYINDLRGVIYPKSKISIEVTALYAYKKKSESTWKNLTQNDSVGILNNTEIIAYSKNGEENSNYYPNPSLTSNISLYGGLDFAPEGYEMSSVQDSGDYQLNMNLNKLTSTFENYTINGVFPKYSIEDRYLEKYKSNEGYFAIGHNEIFVPLYSPTDDEYNNQIVLLISNIKVEDTEYNISLENSILNDGKKIDNSLTAELIARDGRIFFNLVARELNDKKIYYGKDYKSGDNHVMPGEEFYLDLYGQLYRGPYEGGLTELITWNPNYFELLPEDNSYITISERSLSGFPLQGTENVKLYFGIYKDNPESGLTTDSEVNSAMYENFNWYESKEEAENHGKVTAVYIDDPDYTGYNNRRNYYFKIRTINNTNLIGKTSFFRHKAIAYGDKERTEKYYHYNSNISSPNSFSPTYYISGSIQTNESPFEIGETFLIVGHKSSISITSPDKGENNELKTSYDVQDGEINLSMTPIITDGKTASDDDKIISKATIKSILPAGLTFKANSTNKTPTSITLNSDGTTTIIWEYENWQVNHAAPEYQNINFTAEISSSIENNSKLKIKAIIDTEEDQSDESTYRTAIHEVSISNLAGSSVIKEVNKNFVDTKETFNIVTTIKNNSSDALLEVKSLEILPVNGDANGSKFSGSYTITIVSLAENQKIYYTTTSINSLGLAEDNYGKLTLKSIDLATDSNWIEVQENDVIPNTATAIATYLDTVNASSLISYELQITPSSNEQSNEYIFTTNISSANFENSIKSNTVKITVAERNITGFAFVDSNRNNIYDENDELISNNVVKLLKEDNTIVESTQTDTNGNYTFKNVEKGNYYVEFSIPANYELITKNAGDSSNSSSVNENNKTDLITGHNSSPTKEKVVVDNINLGIRKISAELIVKHVDENGNELDKQTLAVYFGDEYTTTIGNVPQNYELKSKSSNFEGIVSSKTIEVTYYYQKKNSNIEATITKNSSNEITKKDEKVEYTIKYNAKIVDYIGNSTITIIDKLPYKIDTSKSDIAGATYDESNMTLTWTEDWSIDTYNNNDTKEITKTIKLVFIGINGTERLLNNSISGKIVLDNNTHETEHQSNTNIKIPGKIIVHHYVKDTEEKISEDETITDLIGNSYTTKQKEVEGYKLVTKPNTEEIVFKEEPQEVTYEYEKIIIKVDTHVDGIGGTIEGTEELYYGDDSTDKFIVITPDEGYEIAKVTINGEEIELDEDPTKPMVLGQFLDLREDKIILVKFQKIVDLENPETGEHQTITILVAIISLIAIVAILKKKRYQVINKI